MSVESFSGFGRAEFARRNFWEAELYDADGKYVWWNYLIKSVTVPKISLDVSDIYGGSTKAYNGWKLPDSITLTIWETSGHAVEKYLDSWMLGNIDKNGKTIEGTGVFNMDTGALQVADESVLYRKFVFKTFIYEKHEAGKNITLVKKSLKKSLDVSMEEIIGYATDLKEWSGTLKDGAKPLTFKTRQTVNNLQARVMDATQLVRGSEYPVVLKKQVIPVLDKLADAVSRLANQGVARVPVPSDMTRRFIPPLIIPPPVMKVPVVTQVAPSIDFKAKKVVPLTNPMVGGEYATINQVDNIYHLVQQVKMAMSKTTSTESSSINLGSLKYESNQVTTSSTTYLVAISSYDVGSYGYESGEGVSYNVTLAVKDIKRTTH